jgi:sortase A
MLTCSELFHTRNRNVVFGDLTETIDKAEKATTKAKA